MRNIILFLVSIVMLSGCSKLRPYRVDVQQGNIVDAASRAKLRLGMSKGAVNSLLGTPVLVDTFDPNTWIYAYTKQINGGRIDKKRLILKFKSNKLAQIK